MSKASEYRTRREKIDILLKKTGRDVADRTKVVQEVDTKQSDFKAGNYKTVTQTLKNPDESAYADYLLIDSHGLPLAVIEARRLTRTIYLGRSRRKITRMISRNKQEKMFLFS